jgi:hypothetical protein
MDHEIEDEPQPPPSKRQREDSPGGVVFRDVDAAEVLSSLSAAAAAAAAATESNSEETTTAEDREFSLKFLYPNVPQLESDFPVCSPQIFEELQFKLQYLKSVHLRGDPIKSVLVTFGRDDWNTYTIIVEKRSGEKCEYGNTSGEEN